jgi:di/tricarboxylate transporter
VRRASAAWNLGVRETDAAGLVTDEIGVAEVILTPRSRLIGKTLLEARFGEQYNLTVLGVSRQGQRLTDVDRLRLAFGDTLLVQGKWESMRALRRDRRNIILIGALLILAGMLLLMVTNTMSVTMATMFAALAMVLAGCLTMDEAYDAIDWKSVVLIAGMLPMSIALTRVGLVDLAAAALVNTLGELAPRAVLAGLFLLTALFTQVLSNTATTVILAPVALATAVSLGVAPQSFMMGVAVAASMAFASPVASPTNTLVMGAGGYGFRDYARVGVPLIFLCLLISVLVLPFLWPF